MSLRRSLVAVTALIGIGAVSALGCSSEAGDDVGDTEGAATPDNKSTAPISSFEQAQTCDLLMKSRAGFRDADLAEGMLRWQCGDVPDVTTSKCEENLELLRQAEAEGKNVQMKRDQALRFCGDGLGQEYCEYNAIAKGQIVNVPSALNKAGVKDSDTVQCVFTSIYSDSMEDQTAQYRDFAGGKLVSSGALAGVTADTKLEPRAEGMRQGVNSRGAADTLLADCAHLATQKSHQGPDGKAIDHAAVWADAQRQTACYRAYVSAQTAGNKDLVSKLEQACGGAKIMVAPSIDPTTGQAWKTKAGRALSEGEIDCKRTADPDIKSACKPHFLGVDLSKDANWAKAAALGVTVDEQNDADRDVSSCVMVKYAENGGVPWRNSDPTICGRAFRVASECGATGFGGIPGGGNLQSTELRFDGFEMRGWANRLQLPNGCKYAIKADGTACSAEDSAAGKCYTRMVVCTPAASDVKAYKTQKKPLQELCKDKFGPNVAMQAPVGLLVQGNLRTDTPFCKAFAEGSSKIKAAVLGGAKKN